MKKLFFSAGVLLVLSACQSPVAVEDDATPSEEPQSDVLTPTKDARLDIALCSDASSPLVVVDNEPFRMNENGALGQFSMTGKLVTQAETAPFSGEPITVVYLVAAPDGSEAFNYFFNIGPSLNKVMNEHLYLKMGLLSENILDTSSYISAAAQAKLLSALDTDNEVTVTALVASLPGKGASANTVSPCVIDVE